MSETKDIEFIDGLFAKRHDNAPDFVICNLSIKKEEFIEFLQRNPDEWENIQIKRSKAGKIYAAVDNFKPNENANKNENQQTQSNDPQSDDLPF